MCVCACERVCVPAGVCFSSVGYDTGTENWKICRGIEIRYIS